MMSRTVAITSRAVALYYLLKLCMCVDTTLELSPHQRNKIPPWQDFEEILYECTNHDGMYVW